MEFFDVGFHEWSSLGGEGTSSTKGTSASSKEEWVEFFDIEFMEGASVGRPSPVGRGESQHGPLRPPRSNPSSLVDPRREGCLCPSVIGPQSGCDGRQGGDEDLVEGSEQVEGGGDEREGEEGVPTEGARGAGGHSGHTTLFFFFFLPLLLLLLPLLLGSRW